MLHSIYKKLKKQKILLLTTSFLALPALIVSCSDPHQESPKNISKSPAPGQGNNNPVPGQGNTNPEPVEGNTNPEKPIQGSPILEDNSEIITNSVLGFNGQKKNPKVAKNRFDVTKNYTEVIPKASFILDNGGTGKYGLLPYWYYLQSIPKYLEKNNYIINNKYNKEEYLKRLEYFDGKIKEYWKYNLLEYHSDGIPGTVEVWKQGLRKQYEEFLSKAGEKNPDYRKQADLGNEDKVDPKSIKKDEYFSIIKPELDKYNAQIPKEMKYNVVFDFLLGNQRIWPAQVDNVVYGGYPELDEARLFRDDLYIEKGYKPSQPEKLWYELGWFMLRPQRIISSANVARIVLENIGDIEKNLFDLTNKNESIDKQLKTGAITNFIKQLAVFLSPKHHLSLRKDLIFNIDISNNADDQSLISDFIEYYNQKLVPLIWRYNSEQKNSRNKISSLTKDLKDLKEDMFFNKYLKDYLPKIKELTDEEDIKNDPTIPEDKKEEAIKGTKKAGAKAWNNWLKTYQQKYDIQFKPDEQEIDNGSLDHASLSSVARPDTTGNTSSDTTQQTTIGSDDTQEQTEQETTN
ncbi:hypothetical protein [Mesomycoplasma ovipneumoniae]|uniref:hypothetical protein n=1 Tax=Mesomycoplasma ovipneumoniae TaxID=29562 RepID=UPI002161B669|nr:hypothetical protein [Mesomycoplasma ovipneumoniae]UVO16284.1 hypothetical protein KW545_01785 [Mesomycoplasma ovipneumoniae]